MKLVACELPVDELVVGDVLVQRFDDEISIMIRVRPVIILLETVTLAKTSNIQPMAAPSFAVVLAVE